MPAVLAKHRQGVDRQRQGAQVEVRSRPAPFGGINARDSRDAMPETDAEDLVNWVAETNGLEARPGYLAHATGVGAGDVETLAALETASSKKLLAAGGGKIYDASAVGAATDLTPAKSYTSDRWQYDNFKSRVFACNGDDAPWDYDGTTMTDTLWTGPADINQLINVWSHVGRLWFAEEGSASAWYTTTAGAVTGALSEFDLSQFTTKGGYLMAGGSWSRDGGDGLQSLQVFVMSSGEIVVYQGTDPAVAANWVKVGQYQGGRPLGRRCLTTIGGDLVIVTDLGYMPVSLTMQGWTPDQIIQQTTWGKIARLVRDQAIANGTTWGWQATRVLPNGRLYFNIPASPTSQQHVLNLQRGAWTRFTGLPAKCWEAHNDQVYFGTTGGAVYRHAGVNDLGSDIVIDVSGPFTYLGNRSRVKHATAVRLVMAIEGTLHGGIALNADFSDRNVAPGSLFLTGFAVGSDWDEDAWDVAEWAGTAQPLPKWVGAAAIGRNIGLRANLFVSSGVTWFSVDYMIKG